MENNKSISIVLQNELCTGCGNCSYICPVSCIEMKFSRIGRLVPCIDENKCIQCGKCLKSCPGIDIHGLLSPLLNDSLLGNSIGCYISKSNNEKVFANSQSGGALTEVLSFLFDENEIDAALVVRQKNNVAEAFVAQNTQDLLLCQGSQYTPVAVNGALSLVSQYRNVAVVGLPCQIEGIYIGKQNDPKSFSNIKYLFGLFCAGTLAQSMTDITQRFAHLSTSSETKIEWRLKKNGDYLSAPITCLFPDGRSMALDRNIRRFSKQYLISPRCRLCFDKLNLYCDISFGDCWGISGQDLQQGANSVISRTQKGENLIQRVAKTGRIYLRDCEFEEVAEGQKIRKKKKTVEQIQAVYRKKGLSLPKWADSSVFNKETQINRELYNSFEDYVNLDSSGHRHSRLVEMLYRRIRRDMSIEKIKILIRKIF